MADDTPLELSGVCDDCGHAEEAHGDGGCYHCDCANTLGRAVESPNGEATVVEAPVAEGGAGG